MHGFWECCSVTGCWHRVVNWLTADPIDMKLDHAVSRCPERVGGRAFSRCFHLSTDFINAWFLLEVVTFSLALVFTCYSDISSLAWGSCTSPIHKVREPRGRYLSHTHTLSSKPWSHSWGEYRFVLTVEIASVIRLWRFKSRTLREWISLARLRSTLCSRRHLIKQQLAFISIKFFNQN